MTSADRDTDSQVAVGDTSDGGVGGKSKKLRSIPLREAFVVWLRVAALSFGGPAGQIAVMHRIVVEEKRWIGDARFLHALNYCMLLPGPEAQQLATYLGWLMHRTVGGLLAGLLFILPGAVAIMALSWVYVLYGEVGWITALFFGMKAAVLAIVLNALIRISKKALGTPTMFGVAGAAFVAIFFVGLPFPLIIGFAGLVGYLGGRLGWSAFSGAVAHGDDDDISLSDADSLLGETLPGHTRVSARRSIITALVWLLLWLTPVFVLLVTLGPENTFSRIATFFSTLAVVTFGGAYAVLAYVAQQAVESYQWLMPGEMLDGLGMAETTPGPLIMVLQFVGFLGSFRGADGMSPLLAGTLGGLLATWVTFTPCFLWIFLGAPFVEQLRGNKALSSALTAITGAVVGVMLNLAIWFAIHTVFKDVTNVGIGPFEFDWPVLASIDVAALLLTAAAMAAVFVFKRGLLTTLLGACVAGLAMQQFGWVG
jgi:chromate transporter